MAGEGGRVGTTGWFWGDQGGGGPSTTGGGSGVRRGRVTGGKERKGTGVWGRGPRRVGSYKKTRIQIGHSTPTPLTNLPLLRDGKSPG